MFPPPTVTPSLAPPGTSLKELGDLISPVFVRATARSTFTRSPVWPLPVMLPFSFPMEKDGLAEGNFFLQRA